MQIRWYKKWWIWVVAVISLAVIAALFNIIISFDGIPSKMSKDAWLSFWGSYLGAVGTVLLGGLALYQNKLYQEKSKLYEELTVMPELYLRNVGQSYAIVNNGDAITEMFKFVDIGKDFYQLDLYFDIVNFPVLEFEVASIVASSSDTAAFKLREEKKNEEKVSAINNETKWNYVFLFQYKNIYGMVYQKEVHLCIERHKQGFNYLGIKQMKAKSTPND